MYCKFILRVEVHFGAFGKGGTKVALCKALFHFYKPMQDFVLLIEISNNLFSSHCFDMCTLEQRRDRTGSKSLKTN